jgi:hypothetical protein
MKTRALLSLVVVILLAVGSGTALAQGPGNPFAKILTKLDQIISLVTPSTPQPGPITLSTGLLPARPTDLIYCTLANVGADPIPAPLTFAVWSGAASLGGDIRHEALPAGQGTWGISSPPPVVGSDAQFFRCEFSFVGFASDLRATIAVIDSSGVLQGALDAR